MRRRPRSAQRAYVVVLILLCLLLLMVLGSTVVALCGHLLQLSRSDLSSERARYAAESGLAYAVDRLGHNIYWNTNVPQTALPNQPQWWYSVQVFNNVSGGGPVVASDGTPIDPGSVYVQALGSDGQLRRSVSALYQYLNFVGFGLNSMSVDLYSNVQDNGSGDASVGTNSSLPATMQVNGTIQGYAYVGPGGAAAGISGPFAQFNGFRQLAAKVHARAPTSPLPSSTTDFIYSNTAVSITPASYGQLNVSNVALQMQPGTYFFSNNVSITGTTQVTVSPPGAVNVYIDSSLSVGDSAQVNPNGASGFYLFGTANVTTMTFYGFSQSWLSGYSPTADIRVQDNARVYGSLFGLILDIVDQGYLTRGNNRPTSIQVFIKS